MATQHQAPHAILFAFPLQGHVIPAVHLAVNLASRGFIITFVNTQSIHSQTSSSNGGEDIFAAARGSGLDIRYATVSDGLPVDYDRSLHFEEFIASLMHAMPERVEEFVGEVVKSSVPRVTCLIADTFFVWSSTVAKKFGLTCVSFWTEPALVFSLYYHMDLLRNNGHYDCPDTRKDHIDYIPGVITIDRKDLPSFLQQKDTSTLYHQTISRVFTKDVRDADFVLCNTVQELEPCVIAAMQDQKPLYAIGPLFPPGFAKGTVATSLWSESDCTNWLDSKSRGSVLYASFGSLAHLTKRDLMEIANGLLDSKVSFIWVLRPDMVSSDDADPLPVGFREAVRDRGMIVPWCSQTQVLAHPAIRGFLTHCGWNSVLEALWSEVPCLCFPFFTDQLTNRKLMVDDWKVGINLIDREVITKEEVSENVSRFMDGNLWDQLKVAMRGITKKLKEASSPNGSSEKNIECFIKDLKAKAPNSMCFNHLS